MDAAKECNILVETIEKWLQRWSVSCKDRDKNEFRNDVFYPILDHVNAEMKRCFSKTSRDMMRVIQALNPKSESFLLEESILSFASLYGSDLDDLKYKLYQANKVVQRKLQRGTDLSNVVEFLLSHTKKCFISFSTCVA